MPRRGRSNVNGDRRAKRMRMSRLEETEDNRVQRQNEERERAAVRRAAETDEERRLRLSQVAGTVAVRRAAETEEERQHRLSQMADRDVARRAAETEEERQHRLSQLAVRVAVMRAAETDEVRHLRLSQMAVRDAVRRADESEEERRNRLRAVRNRNEARQVRDFRIPLVSDDDELLYDLGGMDKVCDHCNALHFKDEKVGNHFTQCCHNGKVSLPPIRQHPTILGLMTSEHRINFFKRLREYNNALAFGSNVTKFPKRVPGKGPPAFRIHGAMYRNIGSLHPNEETVASYAQLYILDFEEALNIRMNNKHNQKCLREVMELLQTCLTEVNPYASLFRHVHQLETVQAKDVNLYLTRNNDADNRRYNLPTTSNEIAAVFCTSDGEPPETSKRDIVVYSKRQETLQQISILSKHSDPLLYPLLFPYGDEGWSTGLPHTGVNTTAKRNMVTMLQFYSYRLAVRPGISFLHASQKLFQQYILDAYLKEEGNRFNFIRQNQAQLRVETYQGLADYMANREENAGLPAGTRVVLPSTFAGSPRAMHQHYQDAMAIVRKFGRPHYFITFTCNPGWNEIVTNLGPNGIAGQRPDLSARVCKLKVDELIRDLTVRQIFGKVEAFVYVYEWQKRGLPHVHILLIMDNADRPTDIEDYDRVISAEIPDRDLYPRLHEIVTDKMVHGPCGTLNPTSPCMTDQGTCSKDFPKKFQRNTVSNANGYPMYKRRSPEDGGFTAVVKGTDIDNRFIVPYNPRLLLKYNAHINVEICSSVKGVKYLYKYCYKGYDCANVEGETISNDEIKLFMDSRYVCPNEAIHRLYEYPLHKQSHSIIRLPVNLPNDQMVYFNQGEEAAALGRARRKNNELSGWFALNTDDVNARQYAYIDIPYHYVWNKGDAKWTKRKIGAEKIIPRMYSVSPKDIERYSLRLLLLNVKGVKSWEELRTVDGNVCPTFKEAATRRQLLKDDDIWKNSLEDAASYQMPRQLRNFFAYIIAFGNPRSAAELWTQFKLNFIEDFMRRNINQLLAESRALAEIHEVLKMNNVKESDLPLPLMDIAIDDEVANFEEEATLGQRMIETMNMEQRSIIEKILQAVDNESRQKCFFIDGSAGTGKTYLYSCLINIMRGRGKIPIVCAFTGIAATLLKTGRTAHTVFKLPVPILDNSVSAIKPASEQGKILRESPIIIFDEASMAPGLALKTINRLLCDVMQNEEPFGGKVMVLGGDFRQVLPVVPHAARAAIVSSSLKRSSLWDKFEPLRLTRNMRTGEGELEYAHWLLQLGEGNNSVENEYGNELIEVPDNCCENGSIIDYVYGPNLEYINTGDNRAILCPKNEDCDTINSEIVKRMAGREHIYKSIDEIVTDNENEQQNFPTEFLNSLTPAGLPPHNLTLKIGSIIILIRNLNTKRGVVNGTRLIVKRLSLNTIEAEIITGESRGEIVLLPKIDLAPNDPNMPFQIKRRQFPIRLAFAITINKAQGQTFDRIGIYLPNPVFSHGQLYVAFSRVRSWRNVKVKVIDTPHQGRKNGKTFTQNVVFREIQMDEIKEITKQNVMLSELKVKVIETPHQGRKNEKTLTQNVVFKEINMDEIKEITKQNVTLSELTSLEKQCKIILNDIYKSGNTEEELSNIFNKHIQLITQLIDIVNKDQITWKDDMPIDEMMESQFYKEYLSDFRLHFTIGDGNCLFNSISILLFGNENMKYSLRFLSLYNMWQNKEWFMQHLISLDIVEGLDNRNLHKYIQSMCRIRQGEVAYGGVATMKALANVLNRKIIQLSNEQMNEERINWTKKEINDTLQNPNRNTAGNTLLLPTTENFEPMRLFFDLMNKHFVPLIRIKNKTNFNTEAELIPVFNLLADSEY